MKLMLDTLAAGAAAHESMYAWTVIFIGMAVADAGTAWLMLRG